MPYDLFFLKQQLDASYLKQKNKKTLSFNDVVLGGVRQKHKYISGSNDGIVSG